MFEQIAGHAAILILLINTIPACTLLIGHFLYLNPLLPSNDLDKGVNSM